MQNNIASLRDTVIHPTAIISPQATIGAGVFIGPYCCVGPQVTLGDGVRLISHVIIEGHTEIGEGTEIYPFASIGLAPQDLKYQGESSRLIIGKHNKIREYVTMQPGTAGFNLLTQVGDHCLFMASSHVAHDCKVGNHVIMANNATLGGHVVVGDNVIIGGLVGVHQFVHIGHHAFIGGMAGVNHDVIPYGSVTGNHSNLSGLNLIGMRRKSIPKKEIDEINACFAAIFDSDEGTLQQRFEHAKAKYESNAYAKDILDFIDSPDRQRALCLPEKGD